MQAHIIEAPDSLILLQVPIHMSSISVRKVPMDELHRYLLCYSLHSGRYGSEGEILGCSSFGFGDFVEVG